MDTDVKIELKYCERCGGLFFRRAGQTHVYCVHCEPEMRQMAVPRKRLAGREDWGRVARSFRGAACA